MAASLFDMSSLPTDIPSAEVDPAELERAKYFAMIRAGLGIASQEPMGAAFGGALKTYLGAQQQARQATLAQLQAYKAKQEIQAKLIAAQKAKEFSAGADKVFGSMPITQPGGPTPDNATFGLVQQLRDLAVLKARADDSEGAKRYLDAADKIEGQYGPAVDVKTPTGDVRIAQFGDKGRQRVSDLAPAKPLHFQPLGTTVGTFDPLTGKQEGTIPLGPSYSEKTGQANQNLAERRFAFEKEQAAGAAGAGPKALFANENTLRDEYNRMSTPFITVRDAYRRVKSAADSEPSGASDIALLYGYMKVLDPGSTVREGEFATAQNSGGLPGWVVQKYNGIVNGERLSPDMRTHIVGQTENLYTKQEEAQRNTEQQYRILAKRNGLNPENVVPNYRIDTPKPQLPPLPPGSLPPDILEIIRRNTEPPGGSR